MLTGPGSSALLQQRPSLWRRFYLLTNKYSAGTGRRSWRRRSMFPSLAPTHSNLQRNPRVEVPLLVLPGLPPNCWHALSQSNVNGNHYASATYFPPLPITTFKPSARQQEKADRNSRRTTPLSALTPTMQPTITLHACPGRGNNRNQPQQYRHLSHSLR